MQSFILCILDCGRERRRLLRAVWLLCLATGLVLAGCVAPVAPAGAGTTVVDQTLVLASGRTLGPGNPHAYDSSMVLLDLVFEPLVRYTADGSIQPGLAQSWTISEDGLIWTFNLRQGVTFHDGRPFDAAAVKWNLDRWVQQERHNWLPSTTRIVDIATPDEYTVVLTMSEVYYPAVQDLTLIRPVRFLSPAAVDADGAFARPVGTGPWQVDEISDTRAVLTPYAGYWGQTPQLDRIIVEVVLDAQTRVAALLSGEIHVIGGEYLGGISLESLPILQRNPAVQVLTGEGITSFYISTRYDEPPLNDTRVRRALNLAVDRAGIARTVFNQLAEPAVGLLPEVIPYVTRTENHPYVYDPEQAAVLLTEAGWLPGEDGIRTRNGERLSLTLVVDQSRLPQTASMATAIQAQYKAIGVELKVRALDYSGWLDAFNNRDYDLLMRFTWGPPYDPHTILSGAFYGKRGSGLSFATDEIDTLIEAVLRTTDEAERQSLYTQIWEILDAEAGVIPVVYPQRVYAHRAEVSGFRLGGTEYDLAYAVQDVVITAR